MRNATVSRITFQGPIVPIEEMKPQRLPGYIETRILEAAAKIPVGQSQEVLGISRNHLDGKVSALKRQGKLGREFGVIKTKTGGAALAHYTGPRATRAALTKRV
jgi:hypothetical protein